MNCQVTRYRCSPFWFAPSSSLLLITIKSQTNPSVLKWLVSLLANENWVFFDTMVMKFSVARKGVFSRSLSDSTVLRRCPSLTYVCEKEQGGIRFNDFGVCPLDLIKNDQVGHHTQVITEGQILLFRLELVVIPRLLCEENVLLQFTHHSTYTVVWCATFRCPAYHHTFQVYCVNAWSSYHKQTILCETHILLYGIRCVSVINSDFRFFPLGDSWQYGNR